MYLKVGKGAIPEIECVFYAQIIIGREAPKFQSRKNRDFPANTSVVAMVH